MIIEMYTRVWLGCKTVAVATAPPVEALVGRSTTSARLRPPPPSPT